MIKRCLGSRRGVAPRLEPVAVMRLHGNRPADENLMRRYTLSGDLAARDELVKRYLPFARDLATRYCGSGESLEDLVQVASLGLLKAIDRFDPERGAKFTSFAAPTIIGELKRHFRDNGWSLHVPRDLQERAMAARQAVEALSASLGRSPSTREVAAELGCGPEDVMEALEAASSYRAVSLDVPLDPDSLEGAAAVAVIGTEEPGYELVEDREALARSWRALPELEQRIVGLRFFHDLSQREIGERVGYSQMHVSRLVRRALARLEAAATEASRAA